MIKRITAGLLALLMLVTAFPVVATAEEDGGYGFGQVLWVAGKKKSGNYTPVTPTAQTVEHGEWELQLIDGQPMQRDGCKYSAYMADDDLTYRHTHSAGCRSSDSPEYVCGLPEHTNANHAQQCYLKPAEFRWYVKNTQAPEEPGEGGNQDQQKKYPSGVDDPEGEINLVISSIDNYGDPVNGAIYVLSEYATTTVTDAYGNQTTRRELRFVGNPGIIDEFQAQAAAASQEKLDRIDELNANGDPNGEVAALIAELNADSQNNAAQLQTLDWQMTPRQTGADGKAYFRSLEKYLDEANAQTDADGNAVWTWYLSQDGGSFSWGMPLYDTHKPNTDIWTVTITRYAAGGYDLDIQHGTEQIYKGDPKTGAGTFVNESLKCKLVVNFECLDAQTKEPLMGQFVKDANGYLALSEDQPQKILNVLAAVHVDGPNDYSKDLLFSENSGTWQKELTNLDPGTYTITLQDKTMAANGYTWTGEIQQTLKAGDDTETGSDVTSVELNQNCAVATYTYTAEFEKEKGLDNRGDCQLVLEFQSLDQATGKPLMGENLKDADGEEILDDKGNPQKILTGYAKVKVEGPDDYLKELWFAEDSGWKIPLTGLAPGQYTVTLQGKSMAANGYTLAGDIVQTMEIGGETSETDSVELTQTTNTATCIFTAEFKPAGYQRPAGNGKLTIRFDCVDQAKASLIGQNQKDAAGKDVTDANGNPKKILENATAQILVTGPNDYGKVLDFSEKAGKWETQLTGLEDGTYTIALMKSNLKANGYTQTGEVAKKLEIVGGQTQTGSQVNSVTLGQDAVEATYTYTATFKPGGSGSSSPADTVLVVNFACVENVTNSQTGQTSKNPMMGRYQLDSDGNPVKDDKGNYKKLLSGQAKVTVTGPDGYKKDIVFSEQNNKWKETLTGLADGEYTLTLAKDSNIQAEGYTWARTIRTLVIGKDTATGDHVTTVTLGADSKNANYTFTAEFEKAGQQQQQQQQQKNPLSNNRNNALQESEGKQLLGEIVIKAVDDRGYTLPGAKFELHGKREEPVPLEVDSRGIIQEDWGAYAEEGKQLSWVIKQSNEIEGYEMTTDSFSVQITKLNGQPQIEFVLIQEGNLFERLLRSDKIKDGSEGETILYFKNPRKKADISVSYDLKVDVESECRNAAETKKEFQQIKHKFILNWKDDNGKPKEEVLALEPGKTVQFETKLPYGKEYTLTVADAHMFNCKINGKSSSILKEKISVDQSKNGNIPVKASIEYDIDKGQDQDLYMTKVSRLAKKPLKGAKFVLKDVSGKEELEYVTKADGAVNIKSVLTQPGIYQLKEMKAPLGCIRIRKPIEIHMEIGYTPQEINGHIVLQQGLKARIDNSAVELQEDGSYYILNTKLGENPKTGDSSYIFVWAGVMALSAAGLTVVLVKQAKKKSKKPETKETEETAE